MKLKQVILTEEQKNAFNYRGLGALCHELHMSMTGAGFDIGLEDLHKYYTWITYKLNKWRDQGLHCAVYDNAVKSLVLITLTELISWMETKGELYFGSEESSK